MYCVHCKLKSVNVGGDLCDYHLSELVAFNRKEQEERIKQIRTTHYYIPDNTDVGEGTRHVWSGFVVYDALGKTIKEFLDSMSISEVDQDGGDLDTLGFWDAPSEVQNVILDIAEIAWDDVNTEEVG